MTLCKNGKTICLDDPMIIEAFIEGGWVEFKEEPKVAEPTPKPSTKATTKKSK